MPRHHLCCASQFADTAQTISWTTSVCESALIMTEYPTLSMSTQTMSFLTSFVGISTTSASRLRITPEFLAGWLLVAGGTLLRLSTFRTMGRFFTFELAVKKDHQLITTGPYAIVRHPSYTACIILFAGSALVTLGRGSWLTECAAIWSSAFGRVGAGLLIGWWIWATKVLIGRTKSEDAILKKEFGPQWETWVENTPYKLFPGIY